ncbi:DUF423 domain-containing protein [Sphingobacterium psychroaquaticum]|uniref:Uncharacterized membrane protein YgdD, TMEM256/DUF423 family n=1 Tax=Sphingobacterium psychroaquaticum TaxID=561061 RepID=A0A1X7IQK0_9SPHI|nr:DUF423 domain-containing protein [Sphingobacterium psychroaquaticum]QBQ41316.1 DUF423 domain-containing protein [Sphingobacterium psychroaquaticum]SMG16741.1 Uncharacterized membrane protein YgdD, TMEM256/DUF423 family [Sphingobacterium psychroaquaticum]
MNTTVLVTAALLATIAIILGAFGAHAFKKFLPEDKLSSFEVGVRYQMYAALALLIIGYQADFSFYSARLAFYGIAFGVFLFSGSIYLLAFANHWKVNLRFLGPITPLGGLLMIIGWISLIVSFL